ncbi:MAG: hypothetical protein MPL62_08675 [Alphaproteobacteria bacterium]|nr:hypothetical protein [Alphaproteobacteria bacterium]
MGFQRRGVCPKWTPASSNWRKLTEGMFILTSFVPVELPRNRDRQTPDRNPRGSRRRFSACGMRQ